MTPNWDDLQVFLHVARAGGLTNAARSLRRDPATLNRRIARLEDGLQRVLFHKSPQGYSLTDAGHRMLAHAEAMEAAAEALNQEATGSDSGMSGSIRIGAPDGAANYLLAEICGALSDENPELEIQVVALPRIFNLSRREADMAVSVTPPKSGRQIIQKITDYKLHLAAHRDYLAAHGPITDMAQLRDHRIISYIGDLIFADELDYLSELGPDITPRLTSNSVSVQMQFARAAAGLCIVHDFALPHMPELTKILTQEISLTRSFYLIRHAGDQRVERLNRFTREFVTKMRHLVTQREAQAGNNALGDVNVTKDVASK